VVPVPEKSSAAKTELFARSESELKKFCSRGCRMHTIIAMKGALQKNFASKLLKDSKTKSEKNYD
jgi:hypothetical protein